MFEVFYRTPKGRSVGRSFPDEQSMCFFLYAFRKPARIMYKGVHIGKVWKDGKRWNWAYDPELATPNKACSGRIAGVSTAEGLSKPSAIRH